MNNIFLFDIDGTLSVNGEIPKSAIKTIERIKKDGNLLLLCSGRCIAQLDQNIIDLRLDGAILNNGGYAFIKDKVIFKSPISKDTILDLMKEDCTITILGKDSFVYLNGNVNQIKEFCDFFTIKYPEKCDYNFFDENEFYSLGIYSKKDLDSIMPKYKDLTILRVNPYGYDSFNKGISKASPINEIRKIYPEARIIGFGDNYNDKEMLEAVDISIVMGSAPSEIKKLADFVTTNALDNGIEYAFNMFLDKME